MSAADGHKVADSDDLAPFDRCEWCKHPIEQDPQTGRLVTLATRNPECYRRPE